MSAVLGLALLLAFTLAIFVVVPLLLAPVVLVATWWHHSRPTALDEEETPAPAVALAARRVTPPADAPTGIAVAPAA